MFAVTPARIVLINCKSHLIERHPHSPEPVSSIGGVPGVLQQNLSSFNLFGQKLKQTTGAAAEHWAHQGAPRGV